MDSNNDILKEVIFNEINFYIFTPSLINKVK